jgi:glycerophosphoryl diester phosphodiesterase
MRMTRREMTLLTVAAGLGPWPAWATAPAPLIFFDAGAPDRPAYDRAISQGADFLVAPVTPSKDGVLIVAPDNELSAVTDIASRPEFAARRATRAFNGARLDGWFAEDFTLAELQTLATGPVAKGAAAPPHLLTLRDVTAIARAGSVREARVVGVSPRMVRPLHFAGGDLAVEPALANVIALEGYDSRAAAMIVQAAEPTVLKSFGTLSRARRALIEDTAGGAPAPGAAEAIAPTESLVVNDAIKGPMTATGLVPAAHAAAQAVYARQRPAAPHEPHGPRERLTALFLAGVDGVMCRDIAQAARARGDALNRTRDE